MRDYYIQNTGDEMYPGQSCENFTRLMTPLPTNRDVLDTICSVGQQIHSDCCNFNMDVQTGIQELGKNIEKLGRTKRKQRVSSQIAILNNGTLGIVEYYDNQDTEYIQLATNLAGEWKVYRIQFSGSNSMSDYFAINFLLSGQWILGEIAKLRGPYLFGLFVKSGVFFTEKIARTRVCNILFEKFAPLICNTEQIYTLPARAGWYYRKFSDACQYPVGFQVILKELPIYTKTLQKMTMNSEQINTYFTEIATIKNWKQRVLITIIPIIGICNSILAESGLKLKHSFNFVITENGFGKKISELMQIFNRNQTVPYSLLARPGEVRKLLTDAKDEVLIFDAIVDEEDSNERKRKIKENLKMITRIVSEEMGTMENLGGCPQIVVVYLSRSKYLSGNVRNIIIEELTKNEGDSEKLKNAISAVFSDIIRYVECNYDAVCRAFEKAKQIGGEADVQVFNAAYGLMQMYWNEYGLGMAEKLKLPVKWNFSEILQEEIFTEDCCEEFVRIVRQEAQHFQILEKKRGVNFCQNALYFNSVYLWIPVNILKRMMGKHGMRPHLTAILIQLRDIKKLVTDSSGLSRKLQIADNRFETYQFNRNLFEVEGNIDIVELGKEEENA